MNELIAHITDLHLDETFPFNDCITARKRFDIVLKAIERNNITQIVCTGDIGENDGVAYFFKKLNTKDLTIVLGNHDTYAEVSKLYNFKANSTYYSILKEYYKFIYLDSSTGIIDREQYYWLEKELISTKPIIIFIHHPILGINLKVDKIGKLTNRKELISLLIKSTMEVTIYCGHYHMESKLTYKNITQFITPAISYQIQKKTDVIDIDTTVFGYRIIELKGAKQLSKIQLLSNAD
ncbi:metallophosphoesterase [uncultured Kordia sp.]|uniref:metallophosphoesterase family protein n=1 Tax=uncultured Kordia sp. TaxID=507699 RepID=UPI0026086A3C|nr:metallophosphoesterase [uncultured Kordia sp.]